MALVVVKGMGSVQKYSWASSQY